MRKIIRQRYYIMIARDEDQVMELAKEAGIDMDGLSRTGTV